MSPVWPTSTSFTSSYFPSIISSCIIIAIPTHSSFFYFFSISHSSPTFSTIFLLFIIFPILTYSFITNPIPHTLILSDFMTYPFFLPIPSPFLTSIYFPSLPTTSVTFSSPTSSLFTYIPLGPLSSSTFRHFSPIISISILPLPYFSSLSLLRG